MSGPSGIHRVGTAEDLESSLAFARARGFTIDTDTGQLETAQVEEPSQPEPVETQAHQEEIHSEAAEAVEEAPTPPKSISAEEAWRLREQRRREAALQEEYRRGLQQQVQPPAAPQAEPEEPVDILEDPDKFLGRKLTPIEQEIAGLRQMTQALLMERSREKHLARVAAERNEELNLLRALEEEFKATEAPDYDEVFEAWVTQQETWARSTFNLTPDAARQYVAARAAEVVNAAKYQGVNPAKAMYTMIKPAGSVAPRPQPAPKPASQAIAKAKQQQKHAAPAATSSTAAGFSNPAAMARAGMTRAQARELMAQGGRKALLQAAIEATRG